MKRFGILIRGSIILLQIILFANSCLSQGYNHTWLLGYHPNVNNPFDTMAQIDFNISSFSIVNYQRKSLLGVYTGKHQ